MLRMLVQPSGNTPTLSPVLTDDLFGILTRRCLWHRLAQMAFDLVAQSSPRLPTYSQRAALVSLADRKNRNLILAGTLTVIMITGAGFACETQLAVQEDACAVITAPGHVWVEEDVDDLVLQLQPVIGDRRERHEIFLDAVTAFAIVEGDFEEYDGTVAMAHYRTVLASFHTRGTFEDATTQALETFESARVNFELGPGECYAGR